jgi:hypothetical protein
MNNLLRIIAGPDGLDDKNLDECYKLAEFKIRDQNVLYGLRTVGLKSRTSPNVSFLGYDQDQITQNFDILGYGGNRNDLVQLPSVQFAKKIYQKYNIQCASEIMLPDIQLCCIAREFESLPFMIWNPAVDQLGWHIRQMSGFAKEYGWSIGIKNPKWLGEKYSIVENQFYNSETSLEKAWSGLLDWAELAPEIILIQRGCDIEDKGDYRNLPIYFTAERIKKKRKNVKLYFDPSHSLGPLLREHIIEETVKACNRVIFNSQGQLEYAIDGILLEVGTAQCDTDQHLTVEEFYRLCHLLAETRELDSLPQSFKGSYDPKKSIN